MTKVTYSNINNEFYQSLKTAVDNYFKINCIKKTGDWRLFLKSLILISTAATTYFTLIFVKLNTLPALSLCALLGFTFSCIGFSIMHDANHGCYCSKPLLNDFMGLSMNFMGASAYFWKQKHNVIHHSYTNVDGLDDDIAKSPIIRQCKTQRWVPAHKIQHIYLWNIYALASLFWLFIMDFTKYFTHKIYTSKLWKMTLKNHIIFWATKILYVLFYMILPIHIWGFLPWLAGFLVMHTFMGLSLSIVFQLAHVVEKTEFENVAIGTTKHFKDAWAKHQLRSTSNFATNSKILSWFIGGLNFQIEHHLFPKVCHIHYPAISKIVMQKCAEYNLPYNQYNTMLQALASHFRVMKYLGKKPVALSQKIAA